MIARAPRGKDAASRQRALHRRWVVAGVLAAFALELGICSLRFDVAFPGDGRVRLGPIDGAYHARRALYSFVNFPSVLAFDPYIAYPDGAPVPIPPLFDWAIAGVARLFGSSTLVFERVAAWASPVLSALTVLPVYAIGRHLGGAGVGLGAAWLFALLPASSNRAGVGNLDHHAAVALLAACWLASSIAETVPGGRTRRRALRAGLHGAIVAAMVLVWSGSLLYVLLGEGARLLASAVFGRHPDRLLAQSGGALLAAGLVAPWVALAGEPIGGPFTATTLSWMHVVVLCALAGLAAGLAALESWRPETLALRRGLRVAGLTLLIALPLLSFGALREPLTSGAGFLAKEDAWAELNIEQQPLFAQTPGKLGATRLFGWYALLVPLSPLLAALRTRAGCPPPAAVVLLAWTTALGLLTIGQVRYVTDFAVVGSVVFAWTLAGARDWVARRLPWNGRLATALALAAGLALLWPALDLHARMLGSALGRARRVAPPAGARLSPEATLRRFAEAVRSATPETGGFLEPGVRPEYGLLVAPAVGHAFVYMARRPVPANNFGPYLDADKFHQARHFFYEAETEAEALAIAERLRTRFVVTQPGAPQESHLGAFLQQLHRRDGSATDDRPHLERFRLVTEGPARGTPRIYGRFRKRDLERMIPYKLFELVAGAVFEAKGPPGATLVAEVEIATPLGRRFRFRADSLADASGTARVRVPYATDADAPARALGPYRIRFGGASWPVQVPDVAVRAGTVLAVEAPAS